MRYFLEKHTEAFRKRYELEVLRWQVLGNEAHHSFQRRPGRCWVTGSSDLTAVSVLPRSNPRALKILTRANELSPVRLPLSIVASLIKLLIDPFQMESLDVYSLALIVSQAAPATDVRLCAAFAATAD